MGLYLCVFDEAESELEGVEIGLYADFNWFRFTLSAAIEGDRVGSKLPTLMGHSDCDGIWSVEECRALDDELALVEQELVNFEPVALNSPWQAQVAKKLYLEFTSLSDCFFDVDGEPLIGRLRKLCRVAIDNARPIEFQ